jgi:hypothetical protein
MARALRPGGVLGVLGSGRGSDGEFAALLDDLRPPVPPELIEIYPRLQRDEEELERDLVAVGLEPLDVWMERRRRHLSPERFMARKDATTGHLLDPLPAAERTALRERIGAAVRAAAGPRGFAYTFMKLYGVARVPAC